MLDAAPHFRMLDQAGLATWDRETSLAPDGWKPVFNPDISRAFFRRWICAPLG